jgi:hypothetical protein
MDQNRPIERAAQPRDLGPGSRDLRHLVQQGELGCAPSSSSRCPRPRRLACEPTAERASITVYDSYIVKRTQIYLDDRQDEELARRAAAEGLTKSALIRRAVDSYLNDTGDEQLRLARFNAAVEAVAGVAPDLPPGSLYVERLRALDMRRQEEIERRRRS